MPTTTQLLSSGLSRLVAAAVIDQSFCTLLLDDPPAALRNGYAGESFQLRPEELSRLCSIRATSLDELAKQLVVALNPGALPAPLASDSWATLVREVHLYLGAATSYLDDAFAQPLAPDFQEALRLAETAVLHAQLLLHGLIIELLYHTAP